MKRLAIAVTVLLVLNGCAAKASTWIPMDTATRATKAWQNVEYLEGPPGTDKPYTVVGIITPYGEWPTEAGAINWMRYQAGLHGADAIFVESRTETSGWSFDRWGGGSTDGVTYRAKAIAWAKATP
jgi:uncharacterized protein YceK